MRELPLPLSASDGAVCLECAPADQDVLARELILAHFDVCPKRCIKELAARELAAPATVARTLFDCHPDLDVGVLGTQLGHHSEFWQHVLSAYAAQFDFCGQEFLAAIRLFLFRFRLPGESAQIDRVMEAFARAYFQQNQPPVAESAHHGFYIRDVGGCCLHCGTQESTDMQLYTCHGCNDRATFCRKCMRFASRYGHAYVGRIGYGRACFAIMQREDGLEEGDTFEYSATGSGSLATPSGKQELDTKVVTKALIDWGSAWQTQRPPFANEDACFVFAFSVIMLTTNLHNPNVKPKDRMTKQQFLRTNCGINAGGNLPGDFIAATYDAIGANKIDVMK
jgi:hypothetical protein